MCGALERRHERQRIGFFHTITYYTFSYNMCQVCGYGLLTRPCGRHPLRSAAHRHTPHARRRGARHPAEAARAFATACPPARTIAGEWGRASAWREPLWTPAPE